jgi:hypothetical protein
MVKSIRNIPKKGGGRPSTGGRREGILVRLELDQLKAFDAWIGRHMGDAEPSRPEAIGRLIELGRRSASVSTRRRLSLPDIGSPLLVRMHPPVRRDLARLG